MTTPSEGHNDVANRFVSGHAFSRAVLGSMKLGALAPEGRFYGARAQPFIAVSCGTTQSRALTLVIAIYQMASRNV